MISKELLARTGLDYNVLASAQVTITDHTDAANLAGNIAVVNSTKNQVYLLGSSEPYVPNWEEQNLVLRPFMIASNIYSDGINPDLFDPEKYPDLETANGTTGGAYIKNIAWSIIDQAGVKKEINASSDDNYSHSWTYNDKIINDKRQLVIKKNILDRNDAATIIVNFSFHDPHAGIAVPVSYSIDLTCISTGSGATRAVINPVNGTSFYNNNPEVLDCIGEYYKDGVVANLQKMIESASETSSVQWAIRAGNQLGGWLVLDPTRQDNDGIQQDQKIFEIHRYVTKPNGDIDTDEFGNPKTEKTNNARGGVILKVYRGLIAGSGVIKMTVTDSSVSGQTTSAMEVLYDYSDPTRVTIDSSNGDKLLAGIVGADQTTLKAVVTHEGVLLDDSAPAYTKSFDYYWYRISSDGNTMDNMWVDDRGTIQFTDVSGVDYTPENGYPKTGTRTMLIKKDYVDKKGTFMLDLLDKASKQRLLRRERLLTDLISEEQYKTAKIVNMRNGVSSSDIEAHYVTAYELKATEEAVKAELLKAFLGNTEDESKM